jgi:ribonuclease HI
MNFFVDGSYNPKTKSTASAVYIPDTNTALVTVEKTPRTDLLQPAAAELSAVVMALNKAAELGVKRVTICYDFEGVKTWADHLPKKTDKKIVQFYKRAVQDAVDAGIRITWVHIKAHAGNYENNYVHNCCYDAARNSGDIVLSLPTKAPQNH